MIRVILIPFDESKDIEKHSINLVDNDSLEPAIRQLLQEQDYLETPLLRPRHDVAGLYAYFNNPHPDVGLEERIKVSNVRATRLAMACGLLSLRFFGNVLLIRGFGFRWEDLSLSDLEGAMCVSPDLRDCIQQEVCSGTKSILLIQEWLANAAQNNYHDKAALAEVARAMMERVDDDESDDDEKEEDTQATSTNLYGTAGKSTEFVAKSSLCLHCRSLARTLCSDCEGAYFCCTDEKNCRKTGWSHSCLCPTWKVYISHRQELSSFPFFGPWQKDLTTRPFQTQEKPYAMFLKSLGIEEDCASWWTTETYGWGGGESNSAKRVDASLRKSYTEGFHPIHEIPPEQPISEEDVQRAELTRTSLGFVELLSWKDYYSLRGIPNTSPVALLCTFPLTVYYAIMKYGEVPVTVARMLKRRLRIHLVGIVLLIHHSKLFYRLTSWSFSALAGWSRKGDELSGPIQRSHLSFTGRH